MAGVLFSHQLCVGAMMLSLDGVHCDWFLEENRFLLGLLCLGKYYVNTRRWRSFANLWYRLHYFDINFKFTLDLRAEILFNVVIS